MYDIIVIGAGPAGMTAAIYARRAAKTVLVLEQLSYGGQIVNTPSIENYPAAANISGFDFATAVYNQAKALGAEFRFERAVEIRESGGAWEVVTAKNAYPAKAVIIATGSKNRRLGLENEDKFVGRGISYCAACDGAFFRGKRVAVVGGGNTAVEEALYLSDIVESVTLIHRRSTFRADEASVAQLRERKNISPLINSRITALNGDTRLSGVEVTDNSGRVYQLEIDGLFIAVGRIPENSDFRNVLTLDSAGYAVSGEDCETSSKGIFVAGDNRKKQVRQLVTAAADGAVAATKAISFTSRTNC